MLMDVPRFLMLFVTLMGLLALPRPVEAQCQRQERAVEQCRRTADRRREDCEDRCESQAISAGTAQGRAWERVAGGGRWTHIPAHRLDRMRAAFTARTAAITARREACTERCGTTASCSSAEAARDRCQGSGSSGETASGTPMGTSPGYDVHGEDMSGTELAASLEPGACRGGNFQGTNLRNADLHGMDLRGANFRGANLTNTDLTEGADLRGANLRGANLSRVRCDATTRWPAGFTPPVCHR